MSSFARRRRRPNPDGQNEPDRGLPLVWVVILTIAGAAGIAVYGAEGLAAAVGTAVGIIGLLHVVVERR